jgi:signal transduction histidine kinase/ligand-binding sensor domain-containing protein
MPRRDRCVVTEWVHGRGRAVLAPGIVALGILLVCCPGVSALDPSLDVNQYAHTAWNFREGFAKGRVTSVAQTPDGYLWLGTEFGVLRFDGVQSVPWRPPGNEHLPNNWIRALLAERDGTLWIGTLKGLVSWKNGKLTHYPELAGQSVDTLLVDREGTLWAGGYKGPTATLCAIQNGRAHCHGDGSSLGEWVASLYEDRGGNVWVAAQTGLWRWRPGPPKLYPMPHSVIGTSQTLNESDQGTLLIATQDGISQLVDGKGAAYPLPGAVPRFKPERLLRDRDGGLWIGTLDRGLLHVHQGRTDVFTEANGLSGDFVTRLFEDREGNIWVATKNGLDRFRDYTVRTISANQGLSSASPWSIVAARDGSVWLGSLDGLSRWSDGHVTIYRARSHRSEQVEPPRAAPRGVVREVSDSGLPDDDVGALFEAYDGRLWVSTLRGIAYFEHGRVVPVSRLPGGHTSSIVGDTAGNLWIINDAQGLFHWRGGNVVEHIPWATLGLKDSATTLLLDPLQGGVWFGFQGGVAHFKDGHVSASYAIADGSVESRVNNLRLDRDGTLWAATENGLSHVKDGRVVTLSSKNGLPCDAVHWSTEDDDHSVWLYMACGLVRIASTELDAGIRDPKRRIQATIFDSSDGVGFRAIAGIYQPQFAKTADGELWFLPGDGVSVLDPRHLSINTLPPSVRVEQITADLKTYDASSGLRLPPLVRDLEIDYAALSLVAPEKNRFRVKLEGRDPDWQDVGNRRHALYNNLSPGHYRFRVTASNNSGVWNEAGASLDFSIAPAYYQTTWFRAASVVAALALLCALYQFRLRQIAQEFNLRLDERVNERTRIARELHDTLLQSFHGLLLRFQAATKVLPEGLAKTRFESAIDQGAQAIAEARDAVQGLRSSAIETNDLAAAVTALGQELAAGDGAEKAAVLHVAVEGTPRNLHPILRDELYQIAGEALRNAFRHAHARQIEVEIRYDERQLRLRVRDDGKGMAARLPVEQAAPGHFGLHGMHERATVVGGRLDVWSDVNSGTEVELSVPAFIAYASPSARRRFWFTGDER